MSAEDTRDACARHRRDGRRAGRWAQRCPRSPARLAPDAAAAAPPGDRLAILARLLAVDVAVGLLWALLLVAAVLFVSGVSQFIYIAF